MVNSLSRKQSPPKHLLSDKSMLSNIAMTAGFRVLRHQYEHIARFVDQSATLPSRILGTWIRATAVGLQVAFAHPSLHETHSDPKLGRHLSTCQAKLKQLSNMGDRRSCRP
jgi:hypothetical protein